MALQPSLSGGRYALDIDGVSTVGLAYFNGLGAEATVAQTTSGPGGQTKKHVAGFKWTPGRAGIGIAMGKGLYGWIKAALGSGGGTRNGVFKSADLNGKVKAVRSFSNAVLTEFTVPALDASSKEAGVFDIAFEAERVTWAPGAGEDIGTPLGKPKSWLTSNFKVTIGDLPCARVAKVDAFTWRCAVATGPGPGAAFGPGALQGTRATVPDLKLSISSVDYPAWADAARKWFFDGANLEGNEMQGRLSLLGATLKDSDELASIDLFNVGFKSFAHEEAVSNGEQVGRFTVVLYVEKMAFNIKAYDV